MQLRVLVIAVAAGCSPWRPEAWKDPWEARTPEPGGESEEAARVPLRPRPTPASAERAPRVPMSELPDVPPTCGDRACVDGCAMGDGAACFAVYVASHDAKEETAREGAQAALRRACILGDPRACLVAVGGRAPNRNDGRSTGGTSCRGGSRPVTLPNPDP